MRKIFVVVCLGALFACQANAADWRVIDKSDDVVRMMDYGSVVTTAKGYTKAWILTTYAKPTSTVGYPTVLYRSSKALNYYNCAERTTFGSQELLFDDVDGTGGVVRTNSWTLKESEFLEVAPDSVGELLLETACAKRKGKK
jgi:hypothetical protein